MDLQKQIEAIKMKVEQAEGNVKTLQGGKKVSATRARGDLMDVIKECKALRGDILAYVKALPKKPKTSAVGSKKSEVAV